MRILKAEDFLKEGTTIIDVRSPSEFAQGHIPGAFNLPIFDDDERARVGIRYKYSGKESAILLGLEITGPKMAGFVKKAKRFANGKKLLVHCWRGGMRSQKMAWLFETCGMEVGILDGGYKAYRTYIRSRFEDPVKMIILSGSTGSGKTEVLHELKNAGEQIIDLEGIAHHKGSAFGALGQEPQPTNEQFENNLAACWKDINPDTPVWVEDESRAIGANSIPEPLFIQMRNAPVIRMLLPKEFRIKRLVLEYAGFDKERLEHAIVRIQKRLGGQHVKRAMEALEHDDFDTVADITLDYYDKAYLDGLQNKRWSKIIHNVELNADAPVETAETLIKERTEIKLFD